MNRKLRLVVVAVAMMAGSASIGAQQPVLSNLPGTKAGVFSSIEGTALNSTSQPMPNTVIRLRDARLGRIVKTATTDKEGVFGFRGLDPGSYVVEMMSPANDAVLVASPIINLNSAQLASQILKLPFRMPPLGGLLGHSLPSALAVASAAAAAGVLAKSVVGAPATDRALPGQ
jgi:hypothetical protein